MARKGLLANIIDDEFTAVNSGAVERSEGRSSSKSAFGMMSRAAEEMANKANAAEELERQLLAGQVIVDIEPALIDDSFVEDRLDESREDIQDLVASFRERGQDTPILVRPHRSIDGRFETIFGHRRTRAAKATGRKVRAVVRKLSDLDHVIAQGQENAARAGLSFIERAAFAANLAQRGFDNQIVMTALRVNKTVLSKMQAVTTQVPIEVIKAIGPATQIGRDRWYDLATRLRELGKPEISIDFVQQAGFGDADSDARFDMLHRHLVSVPKSPASTGDEFASEHWAPSDGSLQVTMKSTKQSVTLALRKPDGKRFGAWISQNLDTLYGEFRQVETRKSSGE